MLRHIRGMAWTCVPDTKNTPNKSVNTEIFMLLFMMIKIGLVLVMIVEVAAMRLATSRK